MDIQSKGPLVSQCTYSRNQSCQRTAKESSGMQLRNTQQHKYTFPCLCTRNINIPEASEIQMPLYSRHAGGALYGVHIRTVAQYKLWHLAQPESMVQQGLYKITIWHLGVLLQKTFSTTSQLWCFRHGFVARGLHCADVCVSIRPTVLAAIYHKF